MIKKVASVIISLALLAVSISPSSTSAYELIDDPPQWFSTSVIGDSHLRICYEANTPVYSGRAALNKGAMYWKYAYRDWYIESLGTCTNKLSDVYVYWRPIGTTCSVAATVPKRPSGYTWQLITFNSNCGVNAFYWGYDSVPAGKLSAMEIMAHEMGHVLGLDHETISGRRLLMNLQVPLCGLGQRAYPITSDDRNGAWARYPGLPRALDATTPISLYCAP